jgi:acyl-CoA thioesterase I
MGRGPVQRAGVARGVVAAILVCLALAASPLAPDVSRAAEPPVQIVALGDSLMAGYQLPAHDAFPAQLERALKARGVAVEIANAGVSGDTSSGGLARVDWSVPDGTQAVILGLGGNDMLRGVDPAVTRASLDSIIRKLKARNIEVMLCGLRAPPNLGADYARRFDPIYPQLAAEHRLVFYPFFLDGIAADPKFNLRDGIHPTADGIAAVVARILPVAEELVARVKAKQGT